MFSVLHDFKSLLGRVRRAKASKAHKYQRRFDEKIVFPVEILPRTFKDAIQIAGSLRVSYLWIDLSYVVQDSMDDENRV